MKKYLEIIIAFGALIVSVVSCNYSNSKSNEALKVATEANKLSSRHNYITLEPAIYFSTATVPAERDISFSLHNAGTGPAVIYNFEMYYKGKPLTPFPTDPQSFLKRVELSGYNFTIINVSSGMIVNSGQSIKVIELAKQVYADEIYEKFRSIVGDIGVVACYCSMYEELCYYTRDGFLDKTSDSCLEQGVDKSTAGMRGRLP